MANERVVKVFHAARQDIEIVWHRAKLHPAIRSSIPRSPRWCWDMAIRSPTISWCSASPAPCSTSRSASPTGRAGLCRRHRSAYAISDVTHLREVFLSLSADLRQRGRSEWVDEEMEVLTSPGTYRAEPETAWERLKTRVRKAKELAVLIEVAAWREREAQSRDVPRGRVLKDEAVGRHRDTRADDAREACGAAFAAARL